MVKVFDFIDRKIFRWQVCDDILITILSDSESEDAQGNRIFRHFIRIDIVKGDILADTFVLLFPFWVETFFL